MINHKTEKKTVSKGLEWLLKTQQKTQNMTVQDSTKDLEYDCSRLIKRLRMGVKDFQRLSKIDQDWARLSRTTQDWAKE